jgi:hypothetical protein
LSRIWGPIVLQPVAFTLRPRMKSFASLETTIVHFNARGRYGGSNPPRACADRRHERLLNDEASQTSKDG